MLKNILAYSAAVLEMEQAERDFSEAYERLSQEGSNGYSPGDYELWHLGGYVAAAERLMRDMPAWEA